MITGELRQLIAPLSANIVGGSAVFTGVVIDSRKIRPGNIYVAIVGERLDGHDFAEQAVSAGAVALIVEQELPMDIPQLVVKESTLALGQLAHWWRQQFSISFVGITGSCGKTTTTRMVGAICSQQGVTLVPEGNLNNQFGVPLTLFGLSPEHQFAVIEMGANRKGDIRYLANIVQPDVSVVTNVAPVHLENEAGIGFGTIENVFAEKSEIFHALSTDGVAVVNADDAYYSTWQQLPVKQISFGFDDTADVYATNLVANEQLQYQFTLHTPIGKAAIHLSSIGRHNVPNALAASAVALGLGLSLPQIQAGLANVPTVAQRMIRHQLANGTIVIDDSYNSNLRSAKAVLDMLAESSAESIAVLGDMLEMGAMSQSAHFEVGQYAKKLGIRHLLCYGNEAKYMAQGFGQPNDFFTDSTNLLERLKLLLSKDSMVVIKGSNGLGMHRIVEDLLEDV